MSKDRKRVIWSWFPVTFLTAIFCCVLWGSAPSAIKTAYQLFRIGSEDTASRIVLAGTRFLATGVVTILIGSILAGSRVPAKQDQGRLCRMPCIGRYYQV